MSFTVTKGMVWCFSRFGVMRIVLWRKKLLQAAASLGNNSLAKFSKRLRCTPGGIAYHTYMHIGTDDDTVIQLITPNYVLGRSYSRYHRRTPNLTSDRAKEQHQ